eukprot:g3404.t1
MPRNQYLTIDDTSVVVDGIVKVFVNVKGMKLGYSTVVRVDVTLGCSAGTALGSPLATLEGIYLLNDEGEAINRLTGPWTGTMVDFKNINKVLDCLPAEGYEPQGPNTGCRGVGNSNVENRDYVSVLGADTEGVCRIKCEEHTATCYGYEFKPNARKNLGYCRIWIRDIETTVYQEDATCVIREVPRPPVQKIYLDLGENTACRSPEGSDATTNYETLDAADLAACKARCDASPRPCYGIDFLPAGFRQPNPICKIWIKPIDPQRPGTANKNRCHVKVVGCPSLLTCGGCADRPDCSWQNEQCQTGHCPIQDIGCYTTADSCPVPASVGVYGMGISVYRTAQSLAQAAAWFASTSSMPARRLNLTGCALSKEPLHKQPQQLWLGTVDFGWEMLHQRFKQEKFLFLKYNEQ